MCETRAMRATVPLVFGSEPCHVRLWWNAPPPGFTRTGTISISIKGDLAREPDETFSVQLWNAVGATIDDGFATATILNDD